MVSQLQPAGGTRTPRLLTTTAPSAGGRIGPVALAPRGLVTWTCTWQMSLAAFSPAYTPVSGSGAQAVPAEYAGGVALMRFELFTVKLAAATPPKVTDVAPVKPEPRIVTGAGAASEPEVATTPETLGTTLPPVVSTYSNREPGPAALDTSPLTVTITSAGPAPSCGAGADGGRTALAGGMVAAMVVALRTANWPGRNCAAPTSIEATSGLPPEVNPVPVMTTRWRPEVEPMAGVRAVTTGRRGWLARLHRS